MASKKPEAKKLLRDPDPKKKSLKDNLKAHVKSESKGVDFKPYKGNTELMISTGSTLLDLAISGLRKEGGGLPTGILIEAFGPSGSGKTVLLCEVAGAIQRAGGAILFNDPEARLNSEFAKLNGMDMSNVSVTEPDTVTEVIQEIKEWSPEIKGVNGIFTDSLAALSTNTEMDNKEGDKMGMRRAKEFSEGLRKTCRILKQKDLIMLCSNQIRVNVGAMPFAEQYTTPGGKAVEFYASLRLRFHTPKKIKKEKNRKGVLQKKVTGIEVMIEVVKNSVSEAYSKVPVIIDFKYGIDDIRANLMYLKSNNKTTTYELNGISLDKSLDKAIIKIESENLESELKKEVQKTWYEIQSLFNSERKKKKR